METSKELRQKVAHLESRLDHAESELGYLNKILLECGFPEGVRTLKHAIEDLLSGVEIEDDRFPPEGPTTQTLDPFAS